ncbi:M14 family zinc carboxypeptidase [Virgisporangium aliadipatigenens]|uniref:M14 family zinc carboxypeptidase n=1 Tax=Virgisporangium aliadipatigenens TaxID=741659 RepID=UPI0019412BD3|nr:M14 family zinc carboxypeptidase [Virgisporangium aliadipatigenens]
MKSILMVLATLAAALVAPEPAVAAPIPNDAPAALIPADPTPEQVGRALARIARDSHGRVRTGTVGRTNEGRPIRLATVGHGPTRLLYVTQQHGDEPLGTPAAVRALWTLGVPDTPWHRWLRGRVTIDVVVQANPDGAARDQRYNHDPSATGEYAEPGVGYDINRYHNPLTPIADNPVPESVAILRLWRATRPSVVVDYHMQGRYVQPDGRETTASVLWPTSPLAPESTRSKQLVVHNVERTTAIAGANVTRYPGGDYEGIARNAYGILGSASMLLELSSIPDVEFQIRTAFVSMLATAQGAADGSLWRTDAARADSIPARGPFIPPAEADAA